VSLVKKIYSDSFEKFRFPTYSKETCLNIAAQQSPDNREAQLRRKAHLLKALNYFGG